MGVLLSPFLEGKNEIRGRRTIVKPRRLCMAAIYLAKCVITILPGQFAQAQSYKVLYTFAGTTDGGNPYGGVIQDAKGNLYGTASVGGAGGTGVVYSLDAAGKQATLYSFKSSNDSSFPQAGVIRDGSGNLYGTTRDGGTSGNGTVFKVSKTGKEKVLYSFQGGADGMSPESGVIQDAEGNLCGTTFNGGAFGYGTVFKLSMTGKKTVIYSFTGGADGAAPYGGVIRDAQGNLYGTTSLGGAYSSGTVYKLSKTGKETVLYSFQGYNNGGADGLSPTGGVIQDAQGNFYGTTDFGGTSSCFGQGCGTVFKLVRTGEETVLYSFTGGTDGAFPYRKVIQDKKGNLYGTAQSAGDSACGFHGQGCGTLFTLNQKGEYSVLYSFTGGADGAFPAAEVLSRDAKGNLYGTAFSAGDTNCNCGTVFKLTP
jgi:uncharacterized repeat protein (TIGR03803 family)